MPGIITKGVCFDFTGTYKVGDPCPDGYMDREEWARVHLAAGLKQKVCCHCCLYCFPHELSDEIIKTKAIQETRVGRRKEFKFVTLESNVCKVCASKRAKQ